MTQALPPFSCIYSPSIPEVLYELNITIAITTYQAGKLVFISAKDKNGLVQLAKSIDKPMGLAYDGKRLAVAGKENIYIYSSSALLAKEYPRQPHTYDNIFLPRMQYLTSLIDIHDLVWQKDKLLMVNTRFSCLAMLSDEYNFLPVWQPPFITDLQPEDRCHLNGIALENNKPRFVSMLGLSNEANGWRKDKTTGGLIMDIHSNEIVIKNLAMPHTPRIIENELYVLLSAKGELVKVDIQNGTYEVVKKLGAYVRGMAYHKGYLFIACSKIRETSSSFKDLPIAATSKETSIKVLHLKSNMITGEIKYQNSIDEIYDLQVIPDRRPGMVNFDQQEKYHSISLPEMGFWGHIISDD